MLGADFSIRVLGSPGINIDTPAIILVVYLVVRVAVPIIVAFVPPTSVVIVAIIATIAILLAVVIGIVVSNWVVRVAIGCLMAVVEVVTPSIAIIAILAIRSLSIAPVGFEAISFAF